MRFNRFLTSLALAICAIALIACDAVQRGELKPGASANDVRTQMGQPETVWKESDGREMWDYPRGPQGTETLRLTIGPDQVLKEIRNILTEQDFGLVQVGMNKEAVRRIVGKPGFETRVGNEPGVSWEWNYLRDRVTPLRYRIGFDPQGLVLNKGSYDPKLNAPSS